MKTVVGFQIFAISDCVAVVHSLVGAIALFGTSGILTTTAWYFILTLCFGNPTLAGLLLMTSAAAAVVPFIRQTMRWQSLLLSLPQQLIVIAQLIGCLLVMIHGHYPDGYTPAHDAHQFIFVDQVWILVIGIWHTVEYFTTFYGGQNQFFKRVIGGGNGTSS